MYTIAFDFGPWRGLGVERGKNLTAVKFGFCVMWLVPMSMTEFGRRLSKTAPLKPQNPNDKGKNYRLN
jgi:hypothetical protein